MPQQIEDFSGKNKKERNRKKQNTRNNKKISAAEATCTMK